MTKSVILLATILLIASLSSTFAAGVKGVKTSQSRQLKEKVKFGGPERNCVFSYKKDEVESSCKSKEGSRLKAKDDDDEDDMEAMTRGISIVPDVEIKDKVKYKVITSKDGLQVKLEYKNEVLAADNTETETKTKFDLLFLSLVEYTKGSANPESMAYDWDNDNTVQTVPLTDWDDITGVISEGAGNVSTFSATTWFNNGGSVSFKFTIAQADQGEHITSNSMKIDTHIVNFPWNTTGSYLALMSSLESQQKVKMEYEDEATATGGKAKKAKDVVISFGDDVSSDLPFTTYGSYTWKQDAVAENVVFVNETVMTGRNGAEEVMEAPQTIEVIATSPTTSEDDRSQSIAYSFVGPAAQGANDIYWDPEAGIGYETSGAAAMLRSTVGIVAVAAMLLGSW